MRSPLLSFVQVLVLGANGRVGLAVAQAFAAAGWTVFAQVRRDPAKEMPPSAVVVRASLDVPETIASAARGASIVVFAVNPVYTAWVTEAVPGLRQGISIAGLLGARLLFPGNVYNYGAGMPAVLGVRTGGERDERVHMFRGIPPVASAVRHRGGPHHPQGPHPTRHGAGACRRCSSWTTGGLSVHRHPSR